MENNTIAIRYPSTSFIISFPSCSNCGARAFVVELVKQDTITFLSPFLMLIIERLPNAVHPFIKFCERTKRSVLWQMLHQIPRPLISIESAASCSVRHGYTPWRAEHSVLIGCVVVRFCYAYTFTHLLTGYCLRAYLTGCQSSSSLQGVPYLCSHPWHDSVCRFACRQRWL